MSEDNFNSVVFRRSYIYIYLQDPSLPFIKVGQSSDVDSRIRSYKTVLPNGLLLAKFPVRGATNAERAAISALGQTFKQCSPEVFRVPRRKRMLALKIVLEAVIPFQKKKAVHEMSELGL